MTEISYGDCVGETCNRHVVIYGVGIGDCKGIIEQIEDDNLSCSCHISAPCSKCCNTKQYCEKCGWENS